MTVHDEKLYFKAFYNERMEMYERVNELTSSNIHSVYEVRCGSGVNLYLFQNRIEKFFQRHRSGSSWAIPIRWKDTTSQQ